jgi:hypothetical protein
MVEENNRLREEKKALQKEHDAQTDDAFRRTFPLSGRRPDSILSSLLGSQEYRRSPVLRSQQ